MDLILFKKEVGVNKNTTIAFLIILITVMFFTSPVYNKFYTEKIMKKPYISNTISKNDNNEKTITKPQIVIEENVVEEKKSSLINNLIVSDTIWVETDNLIVGIKEIGGIVISIKMKQYRYNHDGDINGNEIIDILNKNSDGGCQLAINGKSFDQELFKYYGDNKKKKITTKKENVEFFYNKDQDNEIRKTFVFNKDEYTFGVIIENNSLPGERITLGWKCGIEESEENVGKTQINKNIIHYSNGQTVQHLVMNKDNREETTGLYKWIGITSKYFFAAIINDSIYDSDILIDGKKISEINSKQNTINYSFEIQKTAEKRKEFYTIYAGPTKRKELIKYNENFEKVLFPVIGWTKMFFWSDKWFPWIAEFVLWLLISLNSIVKDYGIAIILITIVSRIVTYPMTYSSMKSMGKMKDIQPKINKIKLKYKNNAAKMNSEVMDLYKKEGVSPINLGCLPMFLQMPIFISLFVVLKKAIEIRGVGTCIVPWIHDLSKPEVLFSLKSILPNGIPMYGSNFALLPIINAVLTFFQNKMTIKDPNQKAMVYFMPIFMLVIFNSFPSGLVLYWTMSSALGLLQQVIINKTQRNVPK